GIWLIPRKKPSLIRAVKKIRMRRIPLLESPQGGEGCVIEKMSRSHTRSASAIARSLKEKLTQPGVGFSSFLNRKTTPASRSVDASRHFIDRSATPPCSDARREIRLF